MAAAAPTLSAAPEAAVLPLSAAAAAASAAAPWARGSYGKLAFAAAKAKGILSEVRAHLLATCKVMGAVKAALAAIEMVL